MTRTVPAKGRPERPSVVSLFLRACASSTGRSSHIDLVPRGARQNRVRVLRFLTARIATHTPFRSDACLYTRLCKAPPSRISTKVMPYPKLGPFSEPTVARVSDTTIFFELVRPPATCLAVRCGARTRCVRPTSASHCFDYEYPCLMVTGIFSRLTPRPPSPSMHSRLRDRWIQRFTTLDPLRQAPQVTLRRVSSVGPDEPYL